jgi:hypothetical protein
MARAAPARRNIVKATLTALAAAFVLTVPFAAQATPKPDPAPSFYAAQVYKTFQKYGYGSCMVRIMYRESHGNPHAANWHDSNGGSFGLLQLNGAHRWRGESMSAFISRQWNWRTHLVAAERLFLASRSAYGNPIQPWRSC